MKVSDSPPTLALSHKFRTKLLSLTLKRCQIAKESSVTKESYSLTCVSVGVDSFAKQPTPKQSYLVCDQDVEVRR